MTALSTGMRHVLQIVGADDDECDALAVKTQAILSTECMFKAIRSCLQDIRGLSSLPSAAPKLTASGATGMDQELEVARKEERKGKRKRKRKGKQSLAQAEAYNVRVDPVFASDEMTPGQQRVANAVFRATLLRESRNQADIAQGILLWQPLRVRFAKSTHTLTVARCGLAKDTSRRCEKWRLKLMRRIRRMKILREAGRVSKMLLTAARKPT